ncbi:MAG: hypothetical protein AB8B52_02515 [Winogradskyella sp.]|uniref:hypothetical protein n=1 Tax=Winogradskyella sp. TaxID=1883156 RepID=UPI00385F6BD0
MRGRALFLLVYFPVFLPLLIFTQVPLVLKILFTLNFAVLFIMSAVYLFKDKRYAPILAAFIVFNFLFFIMAPMLQIHDVFASDNLKMITKLVYKEHLMVKTNIFILIFNVVFFVAYQYFLSKKITFKAYQPDKYLPVHIFILFGVCILILVLNLEYLQTEYFEHNYVVSDLSKSALLVKEKIILMIPFPVLLLSIYYLKNCKKKSYNYYIIIVLSVLLVIVLLAIKNPLTEKRNALGPIYLTIMFFIVPKLLNTNFKVLMFLFFSMILIFPTISLITHSGYSLERLAKKPELLLDQLKNHGIVNTFTTLNYDAFINFAATIEYAEGDGLTYGEQLSGGVFFFVPRKIWTNKPISSGEFVGEYLKREYGNSKSFTNLSNPYVSEGYINFGLFGVIIFAILLAYGFHLMVVWINGFNPLKIAAAFYASMHMIFFLRGDFTNGFAFLMATFLVLLVFPNLYFKFFKASLKKTKPDAKSI